MIILMILLWSICAVYITHLLEKKKMRAASIAYTVLFCYLLGWTYLVFFWDVFDFGLDLSRIAWLHGSQVFRAFVDIRDQMFEAPMWVLQNIVCLAVVFGISVIAYLIAAGIDIYGELRRICRRVAARRRPFTQRKYGYGPVTSYCERMYLRHCRLNN